jgi:hypothetical protein
MHQRHILYHFRRMVIRQRRSQVGPLSHLFLNDLGICFLERSHMSISLCLGQYFAASSATLCRMDVTEIAALPSHAAL